MIQKLFDGLVESLFGSDPTGTIGNIGGVLFLIGGLIGLVALGLIAYFHFVKTKKFDMQFWLLVIGSVLGGVLAYGGFKLLTSVANTVNNGL